MKYLIICISLLITATLFCQTNISIGEEAPGIHITDWIENKPEDTTLSNKFIVLEFWASWCGPCLQAVPHLNELQNSIPRDDLYFISMTDEAPNLVHTILKRIPFNSIVVSDQSEQTHIAFGDGKKGLEAIPMTVLIDDQNIIQWVGRPRNLTSGILHEFINGELNGKNHLRNNPSKGFITRKLTEDIEVDQDFSTRRTFGQIMGDDDIIYRFEIRRSYLDPAIKSTSRTERSFEYKNVALSELVTNLSPWQDKQVIVPDSLIDKRYTMLFKNSGSTQTTTILNTLLNTLGLQADTILEKSIVYDVSVEDESKLEPTQQKLFSTRSKTLDNLIMKNVTVTELVNALNEFCPYLMRSDKSITRKYDFVIEVNSFSDILESLESYGLRVQKVEEEVEKLKLDFKTK